MPITPTLLSLRFTISGCSFRPLCFIFVQYIRWGEVWDLHDEQVVEWEIKVGVGYSMQRLFRVIESFFAHGGVYHLEKSSRYCSLLCGMASLFRLYLPAIHHHGVTLQIPVASHLNDVQGTTLSNLFAGSSKKFYCLSDGSLRSKSVYHLFDLPRS